MKLNRRHLLATAAACALPPAYSQVNKTVRFILPSATGSAVDIITRSAQFALAAALGHPVIVDNQPGAGGIVGLQALARAKGDGMTLGVVSNNVVIFPSVLKSSPIRIPDDFTPVAVIGYTPVALVANAKVPASNASELVALLKQRGGELNYGSSGTGTILHLANELFLSEAGVKAHHIPYKGVGPMLVGLIGGQVDFAAAGLPSVQGHLKSGALKAIGMTTAQRMQAAPDIPTFVEQGFPRYVVEAWFAIVAPKELPATEVQRLHAAIVMAFDDPVVQQAMAQQGNVINVRPADEAMPFFRNEVARYAALVKKIGIESE